MILATMVQTVQADENKHAVKMLRGLMEAQREREHCDFKIEVQGHEFHAHKIVLSLGSPYFKAMLKHDTKEIQEGKVKMQDVDFECVKACIDSMYTASFDIPDGKIGKLLHVADMIQLDDVKEGICGILKKSLNAANYYETKNFADMYNLQVITEECRKFYETNFLQISHQPGFQNESKCHLITILKTKKLSQEEKLSVSLRWLGDSTARKSNVIELIKLIKLDKVPFKYLRSLLENHPIISNDLNLFKLLSAPLFEKVKETTGTRVYVEKQIVMFDLETKCLKSYNPKTNKVIMFRDEKFEHHSQFVAVCIDPNIYVLCEDKSVHRLNFRDKNSKWERMQDMIANHGYCPPSVSLFGSLFIIGGSNSFATNIVEKYNSITNQWLRLEDTPEDVDEAALVSLADSIYCIGGRIGSEYTNCFRKFTPATSEWINLEPMAIARCVCAAVLLDPRLFVMGGWENEKLKEVECYDYTTGQWTFLAPMISGHIYSKAHYFDDWIYIVDGREIEKYEIASNKWQRVDVKIKKSMTFDEYLSISIPFNPESG